VVGLTLLALSAPAQVRAEGDAPADGDAAIESALPAEATEVVEAAPAPVSVVGCRFRDPEGGECFASADAADRAWLAQDAYAAAVNASAKHGVVATLDEELEPDPDEEDDSEDGGMLAPVDTLVPADRRLPSLEEIQRSPAKRSFWANMARTLKGLVVRKADAKPVSLPEDDLGSLFSAGFPIPLEDFPTAKLRDSFNAPRGRHRRHHAIDLPSPRGTPVVAVVDGVVERLGRDRRGGNVCYLRDESGKFIFYYAHLARHAEGLHVGSKVKKGDALGEVGSTGHVIGGPHLHFAIFRDTESPAPWKGLVVNPYLVFSTFVGR